MDECQVHRPIRSTKNATIQVIQREEGIDVQGLICTLVDTKRTVQCGTFDHTTPYRPKDYTMLPLPLDSNACKRLLAGTYTDPSGGSIPRLAPNAVHVHRWSESGRTWINNGEVECEGDTYTSPDGSSFTTDMVIDHEWHLLVRNATFRYKEGKLASLTDNTRLEDCSYEEGSCSTATASYSWEYKPKWCPFAETRTVSGLIATDNSGNEVFISNDGSLIRLVLFEDVYACDRRIRRTNYENIFVNQDQLNRPFERHVAANEVSIVTYVNNRDEFLVHHMLHRIDEEFNAVFYNGCKERQRFARMNFFLQHKNPGLTTYFLGNGTFATSSGEVLYYYTCQEVKVYPVHSDRCFDALPVTTDTPAPIPRDQWDSTPDLVDSAPTLFLEPLTHRLTHTASKIPCTSSMQPLYMTAKRQWIAMTETGRIRDANPPTTADGYADARRVLGNIDWSKGGLYQARDLKEMEDLIEMPRLRNALSYTLGRQAIYHNGQSTLRPEELFPNMNPVDWIYKAYGKVVWFFTLWGNIAAIALSIYCLYHLILKLLESCYGGRILHAHHGITGYLLYACCPTMFLFRWYGKERKRRGTGYQRADDNDAPAPDLLPMPEMRPIIRRNNSFNGILDLPPDYSPSAAANETLTYIKKGSLRRGEEKPSSLPASPAIARTPSALIAIAEKKEDLPAPEPEKEKTTTTFKY